MACLKKLKNHKQTKKLMLGEGWRWGIVGAGRM